MRLTRDGWIALSLSLALVVLGVVSHNNLLVLIGCQALALGLLAVLRALVELRGLTLARHLPAEVFAGQGALGGLELRNRRRWLAARGVWARESDSTQRVHFERVPAGAAVRQSVRWDFADRGVVELKALVLQTTHPWGLLRVSRVLPMPATLVVYPQPRPSHALRQRSDHAGAEERNGGRGRLGEFEGLRPYQPGDALRSIHWRTTARVGELMVVQHGADVGGQVIVELPELRGVAFEHALQRACGAILDGFSQGLRVGLRLPDAWLPPGEGGAWRRTLLEALARAEAR